MRNVYTLLKRGLVLSCLVFALAGCPEQPALSLHGLDDAAAVSDEGLLGSWIVEPASVTVAEDAAEAGDAVEAPAEPKRPLRETYVDIDAADGEAGRYTVTIRRGRQERVLDARLVELAGSRIFDCRVVDTDVRDDVRPHYEAPHAFFKLEAVDGGFTLAFLTQGFLEAQRKKGNLTTAHTLIDDVPVLTGPPAAVEAFIGDFANAGPAAREGWRKLGAVLKRVEGAAS